MAAKVYVYYCGLPSAEIANRLMLKHYSHIRMEAKRRALEAIVVKPSPTV